MKHDTSDDTRVMHTRLQLAVEREKKMLHENGASSARHPTWTSISSGCACARSSPRGAGSTLAASSGHIMARIMCAGRQVAAEEERAAGFRRPEEEVQAGARARAGPATPHRAGSRVPPQQAQGNTPGEMAKGRRALASANHSAQGLLREGNR